MNLGLVESEFFSVTNRHHTRKINKWALKLIGLANIDLSHEDLLEFISLHVHASAIQALVYDSFHGFHTLFLNNIESFCQLVGRKASTGSYTIRFLPLLDFYVVDNVYPSTTNDDLCETFGNFGHVFQVTNYHILPNSSKFSHVLSGKREISFTLPAEKTGLFIPINVFHHPYRYRVKKLCSACMTEGHSVLNCPDIEDDVKSEQNEEVDLSSDSELGCIFKTEDISQLDTEIVSPVEHKEETEKDLTCDFEINTSPIITSVEERAIVPYCNGSNASLNVIPPVEEMALVPLNNEIPELDLHSSEIHTRPPQLYKESPLISEKDIKLDLHTSEICTEPLQLSDKSQAVLEKAFERGFNSSKFHTEPSQLCDKATPVSDKAFERGFNSSEFRTEPSQLCDKTTPVSDKAFERGINSSEFRTKPSQLCDNATPVSEKAMEHGLHSSEFPNGLKKKLSDKSLPYLEKGISKILRKTSNPENTSTAVTCNSSSHFFKEFLNKRERKRKSSIRLNKANLMEIAEKSSAVNVRKKKLHKRTYDCADISTSNTFLS